jgi:hypothetical protein
MYAIDMQETTQEFSQFRSVAAGPIWAVAQGSVSWLRTNLKPPYLEYLSFRLVNQLFFVRLDRPGAGLPFYRGHGCTVDFDGLVSWHAHNQPKARE